MNQVTTIDTGNFNAMAEAMGMNVDTSTASQASTLARLRVITHLSWVSRRLSMVRKNVEVVSGGTYKLEIPDGPTYYADSYYTSIPTALYVQEVCQG